MSTICLKIINIWLIFFNGTGLIEMEDVSILLQNLCLTHIEQEQFPLPFPSDLLSMWQAASYVHTSLQPVPPASELTLSHWSQPHSSLGQTCSTIHDSSTCPPLPLSCFSPLCPPPVLPILPSHSFFSHLSAFSHLVVDLPKYSQISMRQVLKKQVSVNIWHRCGCGNVAAPID